MNKTIYALACSLTLFSSLFSQTNFDRWDTLHASVDYANTSTYLYQHDFLKFGNHLAVLCDSGDFNTHGSYLQVFNPGNNTLNTVNFQRLYVDKGVNAGAVFSATNGVNYLFWGARHNSNINTEWGLYNYNSQTNVVNSETVSLPSNIHIGVLNLGFFSPATGHDSLTVFVSQNLVSSDSVYIYRKHYNQSGLVNTNVKLPIQLDGITKVFTFNNEMYVAGFVYPYDGKLLRSSDGITFTVVSSYESNYPGMYIIDADIMNNKLYFGTFDGNPGYKIVETPDGTNFTTVVASSYQRALTSLKCFDNTVWYSYFEFFGNKPGPSASANSYAYNAPSVSYLNMSNYNEIESVDTLGRSYCDGKTYRLEKINSRLFLSGNYYFGTGTPGNFIHEFIPPVSNFTVANTNICAGTYYTFNDQSANADSVRWYVDGNFYTSTSSALTYSFSQGTHTVGLIAISGTQQDSLQYILNSYSIGIVLNPAISACMNNLIPLTVSLTAAVNPVTYTWTPESTLSQTSTSNPACIITATAAGTYSYNVAVTDANGCGAVSNNNLVLIGTNKNLHGMVDVASVPLTSGNVVLFKYEPMLTKFDSITFQPLNATGTFTFNSFDAYTYIIACFPTSNTLQITYAPSEISWKTATVVSHGCISNTTQTLSVIPILNIGTGPGVLSGKITEGQGYGARGANTAVPGNPIGGLTIKGGRNPGGNVVAQGRTDASGGYTLSGLPANVAGEHYFILVDIPGLDTNSTYHRAITTGSMAFTDLDFVVDSAKINPTQDVKIKEIALKDHKVKVYPNPTDGMINLDFDLKRAENITVTLFDIHGKEIRIILPEGNYFGSNLKMRTDLGLLENGVYIMNIKIGDVDRTTRIVITN